MKKLISTFLVLSTVMAISFAAPKNGKSKNIKLDPKKKFAIEGVELGSLEWCQAESSVSNKGEIIWNYDSGAEWLHCGWELRGTDMSKYGGLKIEIDASQKQDVRIQIANPASNGDAVYSIPSDGLVYALFNGQGRSWGEMKDPDPEEGYEIRFNIDAKNKYAKTVIKNIELISQEDIPDISHLDLLGVMFGTSCYRTRIIGNEITWPKGCNDGNAGWNFEGIDLSEYDRIRIELESNDIPNLEIAMNEKDGKNFHSFNQQIETNVYEADLSGDGASYIVDDGTDLNKAAGFSIFLHYWNEKPRSKDGKTVVKSVQLLKGKRQVNENLKLLGTNFGSSSGSAYIYDGGKVEWILPKKDWDACAGWNVKGIDFTGWEKVRIELDPESAKLPYEIRLKQEGCDLGYNSISPTVLEANLDGSEYSWSYPNGAKWDSTKGVERIEIRLWWTKSGIENQKTIVKSVSLLKAGEGAKQPERLVLEGAKFGSRKWPNTSWLDDDFAINWGKEKYLEFGWTVEKLEGDIIEVKVTSTDVPLNLKIRDNKKNEAEWSDDGSHLFRIDLKTKNMLRANGSKKEPNWTSQTKKFDFSEGGEIMLVVANGVFKEGKKTVVEYIKVE